MSETGPVFTKDERSIQLKDLFRVLVASPRWEWVMIGQWACDRLLCPHNWIGVPYFSGH